MQQQQAAQATGMEVEQAMRRCKLYEEMGCCAPMVVGVGYRAATAVEDAMGVTLSDRAAAFTTADIIRQIQAECANITGGVVSSTPCGVSDRHMTIGGNASMYATPPDVALDTSLQKRMSDSMDDSRYDGGDDSGGGGGGGGGAGGDGGGGSGIGSIGSDSGVMTGGDDESSLSGGAIAAIVVMTLAATAALIGAAFVVGGRKARQKARTIQMQSFDGMQPSGAASVAVATHASQI